MKLCVLNLRGLSACHLGPYGNRWIDTPSLNLLASQSTVFDFHLAAHPDDAASRWVWRTGCHRFPGLASPDGWPDLLALLGSAGIPTELIAQRPAVDMAAGWDAVREVDGLAATIAAGRQALGELTRRERGLVWIELASLLPPWQIDDAFLDPYFTPAPPGEDEETGEPVEADEPLEPLLAPPVGVIDDEDDLLFEVIQTTYAAAITQLDAALADLLDGLPDEVAVLVTSDHGQALGERGFVGSGRAMLFREIVQVPLILHAPGRAPRRRVEALTLSIDLAPTIADLFYLTLPEAHGRSLLPLAGLDPVPWREYACLGTQANDVVIGGMWTADWSLQHTPGSEPRMYVRPDDRGEVNDIYQHHFETGDALARVLAAYIAATARPGAIQPPPLTPPDAVET